MEPAASPACALSPGGICPPTEPQGQGQVSREGTALSSAHSIPASSVHTACLIPVSVPGCKAISQNPPLGPSASLDAASFGARDNDLILPCVIGPTRASSPTKALKGRQLLCERTRTALSDRTGRPDLAGGDSSPSTSKPSNRSHPPHLKHSLRLGQTLSLHSKPCTKISFF